jgi:hypothetical protein
LKNVLSVSLTLVLFLSCQKVHERLEKLTENKLPLCNIETWSDVHPLVDSLRRNVFTYDEWGKPLSVTSDFSGTGTGFHYFRYDSKQRLAEHEYEYVETHHYVYDGDSNHPLYDSITDAYGRIFIEYLTLDYRGRIIKTRRKFIYTPFEEEEFTDQTAEYTYDKNGNMQPVWDPGKSEFVNKVYSDKPALFATNNVWMLVHRNYSVNALEPAATYNSAGLPLAFDTWDDYDLTPFLDLAKAGAIITFQCRENNDR